MGGALFQPITLFVYIFSWSPWSAADVNKERDWFKPNAAHKNSFTVLWAEMRGNFPIRVYKDHRAVSYQGRDLASSFWHPHFGTRHIGLTSLGIV